MPVFLLSVIMAAMGRKKTTVYLDEELLRTAKVAAARSGKKDYEILEEALKRYLGLELLDRIWAGGDLPEEAALKLAYKELRANRRELKR